MNPRALQKHTVARGSTVALATRMHFETIDIDFLDAVSGGAGDDSCSQAMVAHLSGKQASPEGVKACADQGIHLGYTSAKDLPSGQKQKQK
jgi:hypothetical protein